MPSSPITSWQRDGETMETVTDFISLGSKITADGDCSHEIKRHFLFGKRATTNLDNIFKSRDITLPTKVHLVKAMIFPVVMYRYEKVKVKMKVTQSCLTLCDSLDYTVHGLLQARILNWVAFPFSKGSSQPRDWTPGLPHCRRILYQLSDQGSPRTLEWVAYPFSRGSSQPRNQTGVSCIAGGLFTSWATREAHGCKSWTIKKAEHQIIYGFELWCWRRLLRVP